MIWHNLCLLFRDASTHFRTLGTPYSSYPVLRKVVVPRANFRTLGVRCSWYSVLRVPRTQKNSRTPCQFLYPCSMVLLVLRTSRTPYSEKSPYSVLIFVLLKYGTLRTPYSPCSVLRKIVVLRTHRAWKMNIWYIIYGLTETMIHIDWAKSSVRISIFKII